MKMENSNKITVNIKTMTGRKVAVQTSLNTTLSDFRNVLKNDEELSEEISQDTRLVMGEKALKKSDNIKTLTEIGIKDKSTISIIMRLRKKAVKKKQKLEQEQKKLPLFRIVIGVIDLLLFAAAVAIFLLKIHIVIVIIFIALFIIDTVLLCGWNYILSNKKIVQKIVCKKIGLETNHNKGKNKNKTENVPTEEEKEKKEIYQAKI